MNFTPPVIEISEDRANDAIKHLRAMIDEGHPKSDHLRIALAGLCSHMKIIALLGQRGIGVKMLRHLLGIECSPMAEQPAPKPGKKKGKKRRHPHGRRGSKDFDQAFHRFFAHPLFDDPGILCPECKGGGLYPRYGQWHRISGQPLLRVNIINYENWCCTLCGASYPAPIATDILDDGSARQPFGFSAIALIALSKYFLGTPWARQERLQKMLDLPLSASTLNDQTHKFAGVITPIYDFLKLLAANGWIFYSDDTGIRILTLKAVIKKQRKTEKETLRTGVHTSVILAELAGGTRIALFKSGILHAGEFLDEILHYRDERLPPPLHMADGSSCNPATVTTTIPCACNAHGRRKVSEKQELYPEHWEVVRATYRDIYKNDAKVKELGLSPKERLLYHQEHSKKLMDDMFDWMQKEIDDKNVEPNSQLGGIFEYFLARRKELSAFTEHEGAPIDNNAVEQLIKLPALLRKNAMFFMTLTGAEDSDKIMSVGATAGMAGANLYHYFLYY